MALVLWAIPILHITLLVAFVRLPKPSSDNEPETAPLLSKDSPLPRWNDGKTWQYGILLASSVVAFFVVNAYSGSLLHERGEYETAELVHFAYNAMPLLASFVIMAAPGWVGARKPIAVSAIVTALGLGGFILLDGWLAWGAAMIVGFVSTIELILLVSQPSTRRAKSTKMQLQRRSRSYPR